MTTANHLRDKNSTAANPAGLPAGFITVCTLAFVASVAATAHFCHSMCCEMEMPGGWTMSMMWMRMTSVIGRVAFYAAGIRRCGFRRVHLLVPAPLVAPPLGGAGTRST